jgi:hypothetical protein
VHAITYQEAIAGIFSPPPPDEEATSDLAGVGSPQSCTLNIPANPDHNRR